MQRSAEVAEKLKQEQRPRAPSSTFLPQRGQKYANLDVPPGGSSSSSSRESSPTPRGEREETKSVELARSKTDHTETESQEEKQQDKLVFLI
jgi:hypothetical protein